ncbi:unnamed protein product [Haemonchus placei]|uniref:HAUS6_N domain-containing protein n=1 Tax=Haemonchus placei TaxID=6290 RepID=A0A158QMM8_HAEPC|nr:unnamed protein product [Haemonchus placei]
MATWVRASGYVSVELFNGEHIQLNSTDEPSNLMEVINLGRLLAAFYLDYPLFVPQPGSAYPSLFLWCQLSDKNLPPGSLPLSREQLGQKLPAEYGPRAPAVLLTYCGLVLEAILYCDHFSDPSLSLCSTYYEELWTTQLTNRLESLVEEQVTSEHSVQFCRRYVQSVLELDIFSNANDLSLLQAFIISQIEVLFAQLPLRVQDTSILPRPPVYCAPSVRGESLELKTFFRIHLYLQTLLISLQKTNRMGIEINRIHSVLSEENNNTDVPSIASKYNALIAETDKETSQLKSWMALSTEKDREHVCRFLNFIGERFPEKTDLPPLTDLSRSIWKTAMFHKEGYRESKQDWLSSVLTTRYEVPPATYELMRLVATDWTTPMALDASLIPVLLKLHPDDICSSSPSVPNRLCQSARTPSQQTTQQFANRVFSPRTDVVALYAERARTLLRNDSQRTLVTNEKKIRALQERLRKNLKVQRQLEEHVNGERSFLESISSSSFRSKVERMRPVLSERISRSPGTSFSGLKEGTKAIERSLRLLDNTLKKIKIPSDDPRPEANSSESDFQETEEVFEDVLPTAKEDFSAVEDLDDLQLNYDEAAASKNPVPQISKLDLSLLSPHVDIRTHTTTKPPKAPSQRTLGLPEWMRLLPLEEPVSLNRLPLLQYSPPVQREWKTERCIQTRGFNVDVTETACQTTEDDRNPPDSGFLDVVEKSPGKKIEIIQPMSKQHIREMLSQM